MIKTIAFDLGGVYFTNGLDRAVKLISENYFVDEKEVRKALHGALGRQLRRGEITELDFWNKAIERWGIEEDPLFLGHVWSSGYIPREGLIKIIEDLKKAGYGVFFLSNFFEEWIKSFEERYHFLENFDGGVFSCRVSSAKPETEIYERLLEKVGDSPNEILFIDDEEPNLEPAKELGIDTILFKNTEQLIEELKKYEIKI